MTASFFGGVYTHSNAAHNVSCGLPPRSTTNLIRRVLKKIASVYDANRRVRWRR